MSIDRRLRELNDMPVNEALKKKIKQSITEVPLKKRGNLSSWKEVLVGCAVIMITLFLLFTPSIQKHQATSDDIQHIYTYFSAKEGQFRARASLQYVGMQDLKNDVTVQFFNQVEQMKVVENGALGNYIVDVLVVRNQEKHRYQLSDTTLYDVDQNIYYTSDDSLYSDAFEELYHGKQSGYMMVLPISVILVNLLSSYLYKRKGIKPFKMNNKSVIIYILIGFVVLASIISYGIFIGPLYKPILYVLTFIYGALIWRIIRMNLHHLYMFKVERTKVVILILILLAFVYGM